MAAGLSFGKEEMGVTKVGTLVLKDLRMKKQVEKVGVMLEVKVRPNQEKLEVGFSHT